MDLKKYSNFQKVNSLSMKKYNRPVQISTRKQKKYMIRDDNNKMVHFGQLGYVTLGHHTDQHDRQS